MNDSQLEKAKEIKERLSKLDYYKKNNEKAIDVLEKGKIENGHKQPFVKLHFQEHLELNRQDLIDFLCIQELKIEREIVEKQTEFEKL